MTTIIIAGMFIFLVVALFLSLDFYSCLSLDPIPITLLFHAHLPIGDPILIYLLDPIAITLLLGDPTH